MCLEEAKSYQVSQGYKNYKNVLFSITKKFGIDYAILFKIAKDIFFPFLF